MARETDRRAPSTRQIEALRIVAQGRFLPTLVREDDGWFARWRAADGGDNPWIDEAVRRFAMSALSEDAEDQHHETLHDAWLMALKSRTGLVRWDDAECAEFAEELRRWGKSATENNAVRGDITFTFEEKDGEFGILCALPPGVAALKALGEAVAHFGPLRGLRRKGNALVVSLNRGEAEAFLRMGAKRLGDAGYKVEGCEVSASITADIDVGSQEVSQPHAPDSTAPTARLQVRVAGEEVSAEEIRFLLEQGSTLVFFRNRWIEVDRGILREALRALEKVEGKPLSRMEAIGFALGIGSIGRIEIENARAHGWLRGLLNELRARGEFSGADFRSQIEEIAARAVAFRGRLRAYQARGVAWMNFLTDHGFGALLADDMGLGKTVQTIAWLCIQVEGWKKCLNCAEGVHSGGALIVAPLTLIANWRHELERFAPSLRVYVHHGEKRHVASGFRKAASEAQVVLTSYSLLVKDYANMSEIGWEAIVIDEAQTIKNADTRVSRAIKSLGAPRRIALTGTPVENSVSDLWSIEEFLNPGFLPDRKTFMDRFAKPLSVDPFAVAGKRLRRALEPFMLRRLKSESDIAVELGEKREIREYCELTPRERSDYEAALDVWRSSERRQGDIFTLITALKLVCDGVVERGPKVEGAKLARLFDLLETIFAAGESALVFTQYAKVGAEIKAALEGRFGRRISFLHGGLAAKEREAAIAEFNSDGPRAFILSLKAGGFGLNLVKATHVIHYDRWWNPAAEAQATDRAHRIGQESTVFVHIFITTGTIEERVDAILERKLAAAGNLVTTGEKFLSSMSADEFERTIALDNP